MSGLDDPESSRSSRAGASWVFPLEAVKHTGAFLAFRLNGEPLPRDHGAPMRLVVPGWYGCTWIKWVNDIRLVGPDEPLTSQMIEFSLRTHQRTLPPLARDYEPPVIDLAAMPIRVEKRRVEGRLEYRVVGIVWGGEKPVDGAADPVSCRRHAYVIQPLPQAWHASHLVAVGLSLAADLARPLQHRPHRCRPLDPHAAPGCIVLRAPRLHRGNLGGDAAERHPAAAGAPSDLYKPMRCGCHWIPSAMMRSSSIWYGSLARLADRAKSSASASCGFAFASIT